MEAEVEVIKLNLQGEEVWKYTGRVLKQTGRAILLEAEFNRDDFPFEEIILRRGDRFVELFFNDRWYNIFAIFERTGGMIKAWYCNVTRPAEFEPGRIRYVDLALDLLVYPDGRRVALDLDEFEQLELDDESRKMCWRALAEIQQLFEVLPPGEMPDGLID